MAGTLTGYLALSAARHPSRVAVEDAAGAVSYAELDALSDRARDRLRALGVRRGDRVGVCLPKSIDAYAVLLGAMKAGAAYVPLDASVPASRRAFISNDCSVKVLAIEPSQTAGWREEAETLGALPALLELESAAGGHGLRRALDEADDRVPAAAAPSETLDERDLAYVLYTSGSTGIPKGVMLTHQSATSFVDWCSATFEPSRDDRFSSHAPFHFDLSILDLYVPLKHGATVVLISADQGREPMGLAQLIADRKLTIWYSTPTILTMLTQFGKMKRHDFSALRLVLFAGEVFPVRHLRAVKEALPAASFFNLYGPTETNVCTWYPIPEVVAAERTEPYPIGRVCSHFQARMVDAEGQEVPRGAPGELLVQGDGVMAGYWNLPQQTAESMLIDERGAWYRTGDVVIENESGVFSFVGRRDRMVKRRGFRIELGEIEVGLYRHRGIHEAAVVALKDAEGGIRIAAYLTMAGGHSTSEIEMRRYCVDALPAYMIPDTFTFMAALPRTSTDKVDYQHLAHLR